MEAWSEWVSARLLRFLLLSVEMHALWNLLRLFLVWLSATKLRSKDKESQNTLRTVSAVPVKDSSAQKAISRSLNKSKCPIDFQKACKRRKLAFIRGETDILNWPKSMRGLSNALHILHCTGENSIEIHLVDNPNFVL